MLPGERMPATPDALIERREGPKEGGVYISKMKKEGNMRMIGDYAYE
jgi:hypothetical protein